MRTYSLSNAPSFSPLDLLLASLSRGESSVPWPQFVGREAHWTRLGRIAIWNILHSWGVGPGDEVLVPSYNCGSEVDPIFRLGAEVRMYRIGSNLEIDLEDILQRLSPKTKVLHVTHYFGWPHRIEPIRAEIEGRGIRILEDCALSLFSCDENVERGIGRMGDAAIYCFPKSLAVPEGGAVTLAKPLENEIHLDQSPFGAMALRKSFPFLKRYVIAQLPAAQRLRWVLKRRTQSSALIDQEPDNLDIPAHYYFDEQGRHDPLSRLIIGLLRRVDREEVKRTRRENYRLLLERIQELPGIKVLKPQLPQDVCPLSMPIVVSDRRRWRRALMDRGISTFPWWAGYHRSLDWSEFPEARTLKRTVLTLPIHQGLGAEQILYTADVLKELASRFAT